jgi:hypothetical protein
MANLPHISNLTGVYKNFRYPLKILTNFSAKLLINTDSRDQHFLEHATFAAINKAFPILDKYDAFYAAYIREDIRKIVIIYIISIFKYLIDA